MSLGSVGRIRSIASRSALGHFDFVRAGQRPHTEIHGLLVVVLRDHRGFFGAELDACDVGETHDGAIAFRDDEVLEFFGRAQVGVGEQVDLDEVALGLAHRRQVVVALERGLHVAGRKIAFGEPHRVYPDAHGQRLAAFEAHSLHTRKSRKLRLQCASEPVGELRNAAFTRGEAEVERGVRPVRTLHFDHGRFRFGR